MKYLIYVLLTVFVISCSSSKSTSEKKPSKGNLKGTWEVTDIKFVGEEGLYKVKLFDLADSACFKGGEWVFIPNNGSGKFTINNSSNCENVSPRIHWSLYEPGDGTYQFQFKYVDEKNKPLDNGNRGYRSKIDKLNGQTMIMRVATEQDGKPFNVVMTFTRTSDNFSL